MKFIAINMACIYQDENELLNVLFKNGKNIFFFTSNSLKNSNALEGVDHWEAAHNNTTIAHAGVKKKWECYL